MNASSTMINPASDNSVQALTKNLGAAKLNYTKNEELLRICIGKLGMKLEQGEDDELQLSIIQISSITPSNAQKLKDSWQDLILSRDETEYIVDMKDTFRIETVTAGRSVQKNNKSKESLPALDPSRGSDLSI